MILFKVQLQLLVVTAKFGTKCALTLFNSCQFLNTVISLKSWLVVCATFCMSLPPCNAHPSSNSNHTTFWSLIVKHSSISFLACPGTIWFCSSAAMMRQEKSTCSEQEHACPFVQRSFSPFLMQVQYTCLPIYLLPPGMEDVLINLPSLDRRTEECLHFNPYSSRKIQVGSSIIGNRNSSTSHSN